MSVWKSNREEGFTSINLPFSNSPESANSTTNDPVLEVTYTLPTPTTTITYAYDAAGQRVKVVSGGVTTVYPSASYNTDGTTPMKHIFAGDTMLATVNGTGTTAVVYTEHTDHLGGAAVVTNSTGVQQEVSDYYPFGAIRLDEKVASFTEQRKFVGEEFDTDTGLNYLNARYYNSTIGRFISQDPLFWDFSQDYLLDPQQWNSYSYARNNPLSIVDPSGLAPTEDEAAVMAVQIYNSGKEGENLINGWTYNYSYTGGDGMKMGIYSRVKTDNTTEYSLVNKGTSCLFCNDGKNDIQQLYNVSPDMTASIYYANKFVADHLSSEITFVGHSKGGAEATANAISTNKNAILFNPAAVNLSAYGLDKSTYSAHMTPYIVKGEIVNKLEGWISKPIDKVVYLPTQHSLSWPVKLLVGPVISGILGIRNSINNHYMVSVLSALSQQ